MIEWYWWFVIGPVAYVLVVWVIGLALLIGYSEVHEEEHQSQSFPKPERSKEKKCLVCGSRDLCVVAEGGGGQNARCDRCGSLHLWSPFGMELLQAGQPRPKVVFPDRSEKDFESNAEAIEYARSWNRIHRPQGGTSDPGAYVIDDEGVLATDPLRPIM